MFQSTRSRDESVWELREAWCTSVTKFQHVKIPAETWYWKSNWTSERSEMTLKPYTWHSFLTLSLHRAVSEPNCSHFGELQKQSLELKLEVMLENNEKLSIEKEVGVYTHRHTHACRPNPRTSIQGNTREDKKATTGWWGWPADCPTAGGIVGNSLPGFCTPWASCSPFSNVVPASEHTHTKKQSTTLISEC